VVRQAARAGDVLMDTRLDRLARSTRDLLNVLDEVAKEVATSVAATSPGAFN